jgi:hypothetical protein
MSRWAVVENGAVTEVHYDLPQNWRNVSNFFALESDVETLKSFGWYPVRVDTPSIGQNQTYGDTTRIFDEYNQIVIENAQIIDLPESPQDSQLIVKQNKDEFLGALRQMRDSLLTACDWTQLNDVRSIKGDYWASQWSEYRQKLRDIPEIYKNTIDMNDVSWPTPPGN